MATVHGGGHFGSVRPPAGAEEPDPGASSGTPGPGWVLLLRAEDRRAPRAPFSLRRAAGPIARRSSRRRGYGRCSVTLTTAQNPAWLNRQVDPRMEPADGTLAVFLASTSMRVFQDAAAAAAALDASVTLLLAPSFVSLKGAPRSCCPLPLKRFPNASP